MSELVREETLANRVVAELERLIVESRLGDGDRLPSERELAMQFGVSRTVVREAVRALAARRLVSVEGGRGTIVRTPTTEAAADAMVLLLRVQGGAQETEMASEVRRILESEIAAIAAIRRTPEDESRLAAILEEAERHLEDPEAFAEADMAFHSVLAQATHNPLFTVILDSLAQVLLEVRLLALRIPGTPRRSLAHHRAVFEQVRTGEPTAAREAMDRHMDEARETLLKAVVANGDGEP